MIQVNLILTVEKTCELDLPEDATDEEITKAIETLLPDHFSTTGESQSLTVFRDNEELFLQPYTPNLNPNS